MLKSTLLKITLAASLWMAFNSVYSAQAFAQIEAQQVTVIAGGEVRQPVLKTNRLISDTPKVRSLRLLDVEKSELVPELLGGFSHSKRRKPNFIRLGNRPQIRLKRPKGARLKPKSG